MKPFDFKQAVRRHSPRELPFAFGTQELITAPPLVKRRQQPALDCGVTYSTSQVQSYEQNHVSQGKGANLGVVGQWLTSVHISNCLKNSVNAMQDVKNCQSIVYHQNQSIKQFTQAIWQAFARLSYGQKLNYSLHQALIHCAKPPNSELVRLYHASQVLYTSAKLLKFCQKNNWQLFQKTHCQSIHYGASMQPPCEWYPIVLPDVPPPTTRRPCGARPLPNRIPLPLQRRKMPQSATQIPFPFSCKTNFVYIPPLDSYIMLNEINAQIGDMTLNPFSASLKSDMSGYCWLGEITLPPDEFVKLKLHEQKLGEELLIKLQINGEMFVFMAENYSDNRQFAKRSYTVSGRSLTAKLGADYATGRKGTIHQALYARQIADQAIADLGFTIEDWAVVDWLVPSETYVLTDKTPIAVLQDITQAVGGFVMSNPSQPKLMVRPRWKRAAWQINHITPDLTVPANVVLSISGQKSTQNQAEGVFVWGSKNGKAADVLREGMSGEIRASALNHVLYTDLSACEAAGVAVLSDSGCHKTETVVLPMSPKYGLNRAELGQIWRFVEPNEAWQGVITGVAISVEMQGDVPVVKQTLTVDRYLGT